MKEKYYRILVKRYTDQKCTEDELEIFTQLLKQGKIKKWLLEEMTMRAGITPDEEKDYVTLNKNTHE